MRHSLVGLDAQSMLTGEERATEVAKAWLFRAERFAETPGG